jgi:predicted TIM-barrel fold metal-dependent hydrolase
MFGSDWPVLTGAGSYAKWHEIAFDALARLTEAGARSGAQRHRRRDL